MVASIRTALREHQPHLHLLIQPNGRAEIFGQFLVLSDDGQEIDRYQVEIRLPPKFPTMLPIVKEVGGRIPVKVERHINDADGSACVLYPEDRWRYFPEDANFSVYLNGPLRDFFLGQTYFEREGKWPFGEWGHGVDGTMEYYAELIGSNDRDAIIRYVTALTYPRIKGKLPCPCGSGQFVRDCCISDLNALRAKIDRKLAKRSLNAIKKYLK
jgi:hypothetical protein